MKKKLQKSVQQKCSIGIIGVLALGIGLGSPMLLQGAERSTPKVPNIRHELVPHVVLPETIQYDKIAKNLNSLPGLSKAGDYGMVSPYVATYLPFPSYQIPYSAEMKTVNQSVYPVSPKRLPLPAKKTVDEPVDKDSVIPEKPELESKPESDSKLASESASELELTTAEKESSFGDTDVAPILLASNSESVVQAVPLSSWNNAVTQTGIFCAKPPKPPVAWSFTSPIFKAAAVPIGAGNNGYGGFINQYGCRGAGSQIGFQPVPGVPGAENGVPAPYPPPYSPLSPMGQGINNGVQTQILPNGMVLLTVPPDHSRCGLFRCQGHNPRMILLPPMPNAGVPAGIQQPPQMVPTPSGAMILPSGYAPMQAQYPFPNPNQFPVMQPQIIPVTAMTPYGLAVVGYQQNYQQNFPQNFPQNYQQVQAVNNPLGNTGMYGMGMGMISAQQLQALQTAQQSSGVQQQLQQSAGEQDETDGELKTPLPINSQTNQQPTDIASTLSTLNGLANSYADPYSLYAQQFGAINQNGMQNNMGNTANLMATPPIMFFPPQANYNYVNSAGNTGNPYSGVYMTPYGMMAMPSMSPSMFPPMGGYGNGFMPVGMQANVPGFPGFPMQNVGMNQGGLSFSDVVQLVMLLNNNNQRHRPRLFERLAERRAIRRERRTQSSDPLNQLMQMWTTPYMSPTDSIVRMPSRNAYPYGYFGAQGAQQDTANYGGYYNLYMGNTSYPGLY
ncbi:MAG: hypothetical protein LBP87_11725 [Planctomycetaceae bacterium]|jgi:hypothetical protein|nr:hypothetical protein [Planctomycetaceae bacterium]